MTPILEIQNLSKKFKIQHAESYLSLRDKIAAFARQSSASEDFWAIRDISVSVNPGESLGIIGRNGAGKSTLLKILSRITPPTTGRIICRGRVASLLEVGTGFHPELTGRENIFLNGSILGMRQTEIKRHFDAIVDFAGTEKFLDTPLKHYSSGMQLRLAFSVAAFLEPEILVIDEVLAVGDAEFQKKCMGKMEDVSKSGRTILFVSHNMGAIQSLCSRTVLLDGGKLEYDGSSAAAIDRYLNRYQSLTSNELTNYQLAPDLLIENFHLVSKSITDVEPFRYSFTLASGQYNAISGIAMLIYNSLNERIGIIDLRNEDLFEKSSKQKKITISGTIKSLPLIEGTYKVGLYLSSILYTGDAHDLVTFQILPTVKKILPYDNQHRGKVEFQQEFSVQ